MTIRKEAEQVLRYRDHLPPIQEISPDHDRITNGNQWKSFFLYGYGLRCDRNCARCPETGRLLEGIPDLETAFFSILAPGAHVKRHKGVTKGYITYHLALIVPEPRYECFIELEGQHYEWEEGKSLIFDDTNVHEVWNETEGERVVLLLHFLRPLRFPGNLVSWLFLTAIKKSPFIRDAYKNERQWEDRFDAVVQISSKPELP